MRAVSKSGSEGDTLGITPLSMVLDYNYCTAQLLHCYYSILTTAH